MSKAKDLMRVLEKDICIVDFAGYSEPGHFPVSVFADWDGMVVRFGGDWEGIPDMPSDEEPTEDQVFAWADRHKDSLKETVGKRGA